MADLNDTPRGNRTHIAFFGLRNAGKSTLVNAFTNSQIAIVSDVAGTTTDPVSKAMEILPLGPCLITDTAGLDDEGELGALRVKKSLDVLATTDVAVWVEGEGARSGEQGASEERFRAICAAKGIPVIVYHRGDDISALKEQIGHLKLEDPMPPLLEGLVKPGDLVMCVCPQDESAPKGRLILPQQQVIRECLNLHAAALVCQPQEIAHLCSRVTPSLCITDSQAFGEVRRNLPAGIRLTSFSLLFARQKGDLGEYLLGIDALRDLKDGDRVLIAEGCTHHRQCNDIGAVKIPKALKKLTGKDLTYEWSSGTSFPLGKGGAEAAAPYRLVVQCGGCMLTRKEVLRRIDLAVQAKVPILNYGMLLAVAQGVDLGAALP